MRLKQDEANYLKNIPAVMDRSLWERSALGKNFMRICIQQKLKMKELALKPMNCPGGNKSLIQKLEATKNYP